MHARLARLHRGCARADRGNPQLGRWQPDPSGPPQGQPAAPRLGARGPARAGLFGQFRSCPGSAGPAAIHPYEGGARAELLFLVIGGGNGHAELRRWAGEAGLSDCLWLPTYPPAERLAQSLSLPHAHIVSLAPACGARSWPPSSTACLRRRRPVVALGDGERILGPAAARAWDGLECRAGGEVAGTSRAIRRAHRACPSAHDLQLVVRARARAGALERRKIRGMDLSAYEKPVIFGNRNAAWRAARYLVNAFLFQGAILGLIPSPWKAALLRAFGAKVGKGLIWKPRVTIKYPWILKPVQQSIAEPSPSGCNPDGVQAALPRNSASRGPPGYRWAELKLSSAALPGHSSASPRALSGVSTVFSPSCRSLGVGVDVEQAGDDLAARPGAPAGRPWPRRGRSGRSRSASLRRLQHRAVVLGRPSLDRARLVVDV